MTLEAGFGRPSKARIKRELSRLSHSAGTFDAQRYFRGTADLRFYNVGSEAVRDMLRNELESARLDRQEAPYCVASLSYVYNHHARDLTERLT